jgi:hypothetical protein
MIHVVVGIVAAGVVADPLIVAVDVGSVGMAVFVGKIGMIGSGTGIGPGGGWAVGGNVTAANAVGGSGMLGWESIGIR